MSLEKQILNDLAVCMKNKDKDRLKVLRFLHSGIKNKSIELRPETLKDEDIFRVLKKQIKQIKESLEYYTKAGYEDEIKEQKFQLSVLESYLPKTLSDKDVKKIVDEVIVKMKAQSIKDMGPVIKAVLSQTKGRSEGSMLSRIVKEALSKL